MNKLFLTLCFLLLFIVNAFSKLENTSLIYDKTQVFRGNEFNVSLRSINDRGEVYLSRYQTKYDFTKYKIKVSKNVRINVLYGDFMTLYVDNNSKIDSISIELIHIREAKKIFTFNIPIISYKKEIKSIKLVENNFQIRANSIVNFGIVAQVDSSSFINVNSEGKVKYDYFNYAVLSGGTLIDEKGSVLIDNNNYCDSILRIRVELKFNKNIFTDKSYTIINDNQFNIDYTPFKSTNGNNGKHGQRSSGSYALGTHIKAKPSGQSGGYGIDGVDGFSNKIKIDVVFNICLGDSLLKIELYNSKNELDTTFFAVLSNDIIYLNFSGGDGGDGGDGGNGIVYSNIIGFGGNGGDGGNGGNGGDVLIYYTQKANTYKDQVLIKVQGGTGGRYGNQGRGARNNIIENEITRTVYAKDGLPGRDGRDGRDGTISYILITQ